MAGEQNEKTAQELVTHFQNKEIPQLADQLHQLQSNGEYKQILARANQLLDEKLPEPFKHVDLVGEHNGNVVFKSDQGETMELTPANQLLRGDALAPAAKSGDGVRTVVAQDGSSVDYQMQKDGKEHPTKVTHPDRQFSVYAYDAAGKTNGVSEYTPQGQLVSKYARAGDSDTWKQQIPGAFGPPEIHGALEVSAKGTHIFHNKDDNSTFTRNADGSIKVTLANGTEIPVAGASPKRADAPPPTPADAPPKQPGDAPQKPADVPTGAPDQAQPQGDAQPASNANFKPKEGVYNPVGPPGLGEFEKGDHFWWERDGGKGWDIDKRDLLGQDRNDVDKTTTYRYHGEVDNGIVTDTPFDASEKYTDDGKLLERHIKYDGKVDMKFKAPGGDDRAQEIKGVNQVDTSFDKQSGNYISTIVTTDGQRFRAVTKPDGTVTSLEETTDAKQSSSPGLTNAKVDSFNATDGVFNPVRPTGLAEFRPGQGTENGKEKGIDFRNSRGDKNPDGTTTFRYDGELNDGTFWGAHFDTPFKGSETVDKDGNLIKSDIQYDSAVDESFKGPRGQNVKIDNVVAVETTRTASGAYQTQVRTKDGKLHTFTTGLDGQVSDYKAP